MVTLGTGLSGCYNREVTHIKVEPAQGDHYKQLPLYIANLLSVVIMHSLSNL